MFIVITYSQRKFRNRVTPIVDADGHAWVHLKGNAIVKVVPDPDAGREVRDDLILLRDQEEKFDFEWILVSPSTTSTFPETDADRPGWTSLYRFIRIVQADRGDEP